ncbi:hypothetical protein VPH35_098107 [Triticum aestivum]
MPEYPDTQESKPVVLDGPNEKAIDRKRKMGGLMDEELSALSNLTEAIKEVATAITESKHVDMYPSLYITVMDQYDFSQEALVAALSHLLVNKAKGIGFVGMGEDHRVLWLRSYLGKHHFFFLFRKGGLPGLCIRTMHTALLLNK